MRRFSARFVATFVALVVPPSLCSADDTALDELVKPFLKDKPWAGLVIGLTRSEGHVIRGYGQVTLPGGPQVPAPDTLFEIGSITKVFTGTLLADQVVQGTVHLDDPVQKHLPEGLTVPRRDQRDITLLHLATHTSGLPVQPPLIGLFALATRDPANPYAEFQQSHLSKSLGHMTLTRPIGSQFEYSNLGVGLLGHALAHAAQAESYGDLLARRITGPLELRDTRLDLAKEQADRLAPGHTLEGQTASPWTFACLEACGGLRSTAHDMLVFLDAALARTETPLAEAFKMAHQPWRELRQPGEFVGLCWLRQKRPAGNRTMLWHNGGTGGYRSFLAIVPDSQLGVVVLSNSAHPVDELGVSLLQYLEKEGQK